jgi:hypothetical protein
MKHEPKWGQLIKKAKGVQSHATVPLTLTQPHGVYYPQLSLTLSQPQATNTC